MAGILLPALVSPAQLVWIVFGACAAFLWWTGFRMLRENRFHL
jgi:hypothetical protein